MSAPRSLLAFFSIGLLVSTALVHASGCSSSDAADSPLDAAPSPLEPAGRYALTSTFSLAAPPPAAASVLDELLAATDGPDDPSRYLIDLMIDRLPEGRTRTYATAVAPYVAAYVNEHLDEVAPRFVPGARALSTGLARIAHRFGTLEELAVDDSGNVVGTLADATSGARRRTAWRTIVGLRFALDAPAAGSGSSAHTVDVRFAPLGLPDTAATTQLVSDDESTRQGPATGAGGTAATTQLVSADESTARATSAGGNAATTQLVSDDESTRHVPATGAGGGAARAANVSATANDEVALRLERHAIALPYTALLRLGFDFAVIPSVVPGAHDLAHALSALVDCDHLGSLVSDWIELGSAAFYAQGCTVALTALAARIYARLDAIDASSVELESVGGVRGVDRDGDRQIDMLTAGTWTGAFATSSVTGRFEGTRQ